MSTKRIKIIFTPINETLTMNKPTIFKLKIQIVRDNKDNLHMHKIKANNVIEIIRSVPLFRKFIKVGHMFP